MFAVNKCGAQYGKDVAAGPAQNGERVKSGPLAWHCGCHILIYPQVGRSSIQGRPTIIPCLSETEARALEGNDRRQGETFVCLRAIVGPKSDPPRRAGFSQN